MELFGTAGIRGPVTRVTPELALAVGQAVGREMPGERPTVVVGRDGRETGATLAAALEAGLTSAGADVVRAGQVPTPTLAYASRGRYGVMLTASHNPPPDNGIKLFADGQEVDSGTETRIERRVEAEGGAARWDAWGEAERAEPLPEYRAAVVDFAGSYGGEPDGITVAVDCGNGMAGLATPQVLRELGADVRALHANVDGYFPARESKPTPATLSDLRAFVADGGAEFGLGHDGDADRIVVVDDDGEVVHEDTVVAILAAHYTRRCDAEDPVVVTTPNASARIDERVRAASGRVERVRLGALHEGISRVREAGGPGTVVAFAAEPWKHIHPALGGWIDAVVSAAVFTQLVAASGLETLRAPVTERPYRKESVACPDERKAAVMDTLEQTLPDVFPDAAVETEYGIRLEPPDGSWALVRPSGTEPYIRIYAESEDVDALVATVREYVEAATE